MEAFKVFSVFSLTDLVSSPLRRIASAITGADGATASLSTRFGRLALAMAPVALAAGVILGSFGACVGVAAEFEDSMAKVGAISRASQEEMALLEATARRLGATTRFTASQVAEAEMYLAMAGFSAQQNVAALPGVLNLAAATATDLGRASDIASDILSAFGLQAEEMTRVADVLALTCATANTNVELLGDTMKYVGPVARNAGLSLEEAAAMAGLLGNVGIKGSMAGTSLKAMINKIAAPAGEAQKVLKQLGITVKDSAGNLRSPITLLGEMSKKLEGMGTAQQIAALKTIVGEEAIAGFAELINQEGIGAISKYVEQLEAAGGTAEEMARRMGDTFGGSVRNMSSAWESLRITIGKLFLPVLRKVVNAITAVIQFFDMLAQSPAGEFFIKLLATISTVVVAMTGFSAGMWAISKIGPIILKSLAPLKAAIVGLGWPILLVIGAVAALYYAYKNNFGGIQDTIKRWWKNITLVFKGVTGIFKALTGSTFELRGELARDIKAAGLEKLVVNIAKIFYRIKEFFKGVWDGIDFSRPLKILEPVGEKLAAIFDKIGRLFAKIFRTEVESASEGFRRFGEVVGGVITFALEALATVLNVIANAVSMVISGIEFLVNLFTGDWDAACQSATDIWDSFCDSLMSIADLFRIGDWLREKWADAEEFLSSIDLFESGAAILNTLKEGIMSTWQDLKDSVSGVFSKIRDLLPFSDAKEGPFSQLTLNGSKIMTTLAEGVTGGAGELQNKISGALSSVTQKIGDWWDSLFDDKPVQDLTPEVPPVPGYSAAEADAEAQKRRQEGEKGANTYTFHIGQIVLPNAKDGQSFVESLENLVAEYGGGIAPA